MGTPYFGVPVLESLVESTHKVVAVYTRPDRPAGRGRQPTPSPVKQAARARGIPVVEPQTLRDDAGARALKALAPDLVVVAAFAYLLPPHILAVPRHGCLNVHPSLLPRYRGPSPVATALLNGDTQTGVSIMLMDSGLDTGPILSQVTVPIGEDDTTGNLTQLLAVRGARLLLDSMDLWLDGQVTPRPQRDDEATFSARITAHEGRLDWSLPATVLARQVRAYQPWPGSYTLWQGQRLKVLAARPLSVRLTQPAGSVVALPQPDTVGVVTADGVLGLRSIQLEGKRAVTSEDFMRGRRDFVGSVLDT
jgi:methionyl-tRNA formyltransferase